MWRQIGSHINEGGILETESSLWALQPKELGNRGPRSTANVKFIAKSALHTMKTTEDTDRITISSLEFTNEWGMFKKEGGLRKGGLAA